MSITTLATKCGGHQVKDQIASLSSSHDAWKNSTGSFRGEAGAPATLGQLPRQYAGSARSAQYVIFSYATPIAWQDANGVWIRPAVSYSRTTSVHQGALYRLDTVATAA